MPSTLLAVDGSARTFNCVDVVPSTGATVGVAGGGRGVSVADEGKMGAGVAVSIPIVAVEIAAFSGRAPHAVPSRRIKLKEKTTLCATDGLSGRNGKNLNRPVFINKLCE